jgi:hypothetical protein
MQIYRPKIASVGNANPDKFINAPIARGGFPGVSVRMIIYLIVVTIASHN